MTQYRSAWGVFKAGRMRGVDDRGDFYRFWYHTWALEQGERPLSGWWAIPVVESPFAQAFQQGGNLVLTDHRLLWEPMTNGRAAYGPHGIKLAVNVIGSAQDKASPRTPLAWRLGSFSLDATESRQSPVWVVDGSGRRGYFFAPGAVRRGSLEERARFISRIHRQLESR